MDCRHEGVYHSVMSEKVSRRQFFGSSLAVSLGAGLSAESCSSPGKQPDYAALDRVLNEPVLDREAFQTPLIIESLDLLKMGGSFLCRVRTRDGAEGLSVANNAQIQSLYPIFVNRLQPFFIAKDARDLEDLLESVYVFQSNYKLQNLALWVPLATIEFAILDLLGKVSGKSIGRLLGEIHHPRIAVYQANNFRGRTAEESIELIRKNVESSNAKAVKFKIGGRMSRNSDDPPGRTEKLIPLVRETFGDGMTVYADSNGSYTVDEAIRIGRILEEYRIDFYEEPVPFDWYEETKAVTDALSVPVAGGEQEPSLHSFRWLIGNHALDIVQPDPFYFGGMIRSLKVARMAQSMGKECTPHISGSGLGYLYMMHFVSAIPNAGPYHEFKGFNPEIPLECDTSSLASEDGVVTVPTGPGLGVEIDPDFVAKHEPVRL